MDNKSIDSSPFANSYRIHDKSFGLETQPDLEKSHGMLCKKGFGAFREKRWVFIGVVTPELFAAQAVVHLGYLGTAFSYIWDRTDRTFREYSAIVLPGPWLNFTRDPLKGAVSLWSLFGIVDLAPVSSDLTRSLHSQFPLCADGLQFTLKLHFQNHTESFLQALNPVDDNNWSYTCKYAGFPISGIIQSKSKQYPIRESEAYGILDWTNGYHARETRWKWACGTGRTATGARIAFNFSREVYDRGVGENAVWIDQTPISVHMVNFEEKVVEQRKSWSITSDDGRVDITFSSDGTRRAFQNFGVIVSRFEQHFGSFTGRIKDQNDQIHELTSVYGNLENHYSLW